MIELKDDVLEFTFPEVHPSARMRITFQRTLRIPDDGSDYSLPPGLGAFPLRHVDDHARSVPTPWLERGGVLLPMYQAEALWISLDSHWDDDRDCEYPFAIKIATGKIDAVTGRRWSNGLHRKPQDYLVSPNQPWLDGYCVDKGVIRQFVAMPMGQGFTAEEQLTGKAEVGGLQILVAPMKREVYEKRFPLSSRYPEPNIDPRCYMLKEDHMSYSMGLAPGGRMRQEIYKDPFKLTDWDTEFRSRCFVHLCNSMTWRAITGKNPPNPPPTAMDYSEAGLPWFEYYSDGPALHAQASMKKLAGLTGLYQRRKRAPLPDNKPVRPRSIIPLRRKLKPGQVREWTGTVKRK